jgi:amino acid transporter
MVQLVVLNSLIANCLAGFTALSRVTFAMGRSGALPKVFGRVHWRYRTPSLAIILAGLVSIGIAAWVYTVYGAPPNSFDLILNTTAFFVIVNFAAVSLSVPFFLLRRRRSEFRVIPHLVVPAMAVVLLVVVLASQFFTAPTVPNYPGLQPQYLGAIIVGGWLLLGVIWMLALRLFRPAALEAGERVYVETA